MTEVKMRATENSKSVFIIEVTIPSFASTLMTDSICNPSYEYECCDGRWKIVISRENDFIRCRFIRADDLVDHSKGVIVRHTIKINGGDLEYPVLENIFMLDEDHKIDIQTYLYIWKFVGQTDSLKITCVIACPQCQKKYKGKEIMPECILPIYEQLRVYIRRFHFREEEKFLRPLGGVQNKLKRKSPEDREFSDSKVKWVRPSGVQNRLKRKSPEDREFSDSKMKWVRPSGGANGEDSDVIIKVKDHQFRAHKSILQAKSPVFFGMFSHNMTENNSGTIHISDCEPEAFQQFLDFLYSGKLENVSEDVVISLYYIADKYHVEGVKKICIKFMSKYLSVETFCEILRLSLLHKDAALLAAAAKFFAENLREIVRTDHWISFHREYPGTVDDLYIFTMYSMRFITPTHNKKHTLLITE